MREGVVVVSDATVAIWVACDAGMDSIGAATEISGRIESPSVSGAVMRSGASMPSREKIVPVTIHSRKIEII